MPKLLQSAFVLSLLLVMSACGQTSVDPLPAVSTYHIKSVNVKSEKSSKVPASVILRIKRALNSDLTNSGTDGREVTLRVWVGNYGRGSTWRKDWLAGTEKVAVRGDIIETGEDKKPEGGFKFDVKTPDKESKVAKAIIKNRGNAQRLMIDYIVDQVRSRVRLELP